MSEHILIFTMRIFLQSQFECNNRRVWKKYEVRIRDIAWNFSVIFRLCEMHGWIIWSVLWTLLWLSRWFFAAGPSLGTFTNSRILWRQQLHNKRIEHKCYAIFWNKIWKCSEGRKIQSMSFWKFWIRIQNNVNIVYRKAYYLT